MKTFKLNKDSLHYRLATVYGHFPKYEIETDLCSYTKQVIKGIYPVLMITALGGFLSIPTGNFLAWVAYLFTFGQINPNELTIVFMVLAALVVSLFGAFCYNEHQKTKPDKPPKPDNFVGLAYKSVKNKMCVKIELE